jgi:aryl-alcohol dehydrogenase-like predicted oxidoreductase
VGYRALGRSGLRVSVLTMGTMAFGGRGDFADVGATSADEARRQVDQCLAAGVNLFDTADAYSGGLAEEILGQGALRRGVGLRGLVRRGIDPVSPYWSMS